VVQYIAIAVSGNIKGHAQMQLMAFRLPNDNGAPKKSAPQVQR